MNTPQDRIKLLIQHEKTNQTKLSKKINIDTSLLNKIISGKAKFPKYLTSSLKANYNLNPDWLLNGNEPMYLPTQNKYSDNMQKEVNQAYETVNKPRKEKIHEHAVEQKIEYEQEKKEKSNVTFLDTEMVMLPIMGVIPAGLPKIVSVTGNEEIPVPKIKMRNGYDYYLLKAEGSSMKDCNIFDGDILIMEKRQDPENNKICAIRVDDEHTLKRFRFNQKRNSVSLIPCNPDFEIKEYPINTVTVEGVMIGKLNYDY